MNATYLLLDSAIKYKDVLNLYYSHLSKNSRCPPEKKLKNMIGC